MRAKDYQEGHEAWRLSTPWGHGASYGTKAGAKIVILAP